MYKRGRRALMTTSRERTGPINNRYPPRWPFRCKSKTASRIACRAIWPRTLRPLGGTPETRSPVFPSYQTPPGSAAASKQHFRRRQWLRTFGPSLGDMAPERQSELTKAKLPRYTGPVRQWRRRNSHVCQERSLAVRRRLPEKTCQPRREETKAISSDGHLTASGAIT